ncbi:hypothetical protein RRM58_003344 [Vibrio harveyi]|uniref:hypothetical protein n=1 Tax=Vibrio harveyi TaxID=669 RepID=UPI0006825FC9|nr:hypothetical protein [Vibrio harveyi]ELI6428066.1 hypothetical protein [Vibrio harveyi]
MPQFTQSTTKGKKANQYDYWLVDGRKNWSCVKGRVAKELNVPDATPIRLHVGKIQTFGAEHVYHPKRRIAIDNILKKAPDTSQRFQNILLSKTQAPEYVWLKLQQSGTCYSTEDDDKTQLVLQRAPSGWMFMSVNRRNPDDIYLSIITLYPKQSSKIEGTDIGRYLSSWVHEVL